MTHIYLHPSRKGISHYNFHFLVGMENSSVISICLSCYNHCFVSSLPICGHSYIYIKYVGTFHLGVKFWTSFQMTICKHKTQTGYQFEWYSHPLLVKVFIGFQKNFSLINNYRVGIWFISIIECYWSFNKNSICFIAIIASFLKNIGLLLK